MPSADGESRRFKERRYARVNVGGGRYNNRPSGINI